MKKVTLLFAGLFIANSAMAYDLQGRNDNSTLTPQNVIYKASDYVPTSQELQGQNERTHYPKLKTKYTKSNYKPSIEDIKGRS